MVLTLSKVVIPAFQASDAANQSRKILGDKGLTGENATSSERDIAFPDFRNITLNSNQKLQLRNWNFVLGRSLLPIELHFEKRVSQLFMLAVLCYNTNYTFKEGHTIHQGFGANHIGDTKFNAAHHATVPCLYASSSGNVDIVFLYRSGFYDESNATIDVVKQVNDADRAIDEKTKTSLLRKKTVAILNKTAKRELTPPQAVKRFIQDLLFEIDNAITKESNEVVDVLRIYRQKAQELAIFVDKPENIDLLLNLQIDDYRQVKGKLSHQEVIKKKIDDLPIVIHSERHQRSNESHVPYHFYDLYHYKVLSQFKDEELKIVENALGKTLVDLEKKIEGFTYTKSTNSLIASHAKRIEALRRELIPIIAEKQNALADEKFLAGASILKKGCLRPNLYKMRYQIISADQTTQSRIKSLLDKALSEAKGQSRAQNFDDFFYALVLKEAGKFNRLMFSKLLNVSPLSLKQKIREVKVNSVAHLAICKYASALCKLSSNIRLKNLSTDQLKANLKSIVNQIISSCRANRNLIELLCYRRLYDQANSVDEKILLSQMVGSKQIIDQKLERPTKLTSAEKELISKKNEIKNVVKTCVQEMEALKEKTKTYKSNLLLELRKANGMKQAHLIQEVNKLVPRMLNSAFLIDLEKGRVELHPLFAQHFAKVFGVDPSLFSPSHFAE